MEVIMSLVSIEERARAEVIVLLEDALAAAKAGEIQAIMMVQIGRTGDFRNHSAGDIVVTKMLGHLDLFKHDLLTARARVNGESEA